MQDLTLAIFLAIAFIASIQCKQQVLRQQSLEAALRKADPSIFRYEDVWGSYVPDSDCYRDKLAQIGSRCSDVEAKPIEVAKAAVSLTQCDVEDAGLPLAPQCHAISEERSLQACLRTLELSSQHWTSYHLHKQQIVPLCYAYKRIHDIDEAKRIYAALTQEKRALVDLLSKLVDSASKRETDLLQIQDNIARVTSQAHDVLPGLIIDLKRQQEDTAQVTHALDRKAVASHNALQVSAERFVGAMGDAQRRMCSGIATQVDRLLQELYAHFSDRHQALLSEHGMALAEAVRLTRSSLADEVLTLQNGIEAAGEVNKASKAHVTDLARVSVDLQRLLQRQAMDVTSVSQAQTIVTRDLDALLVSTKDVLGDAQRLIEQSLALNAHRKPALTGSDVVTTLWRLAHGDPVSSHVAASLRHMGVIAKGLRLKDVAKWVADRGFDLFVSFSRLIVGLLFCLIALSSSLLRALLKRFFGKRWARIWIGVQDQHSDEVQMACVLRQDPARPQTTAYDEEELACGRAQRFEVKSALVECCRNCAASTQISTADRQMRLAKDSKGGFCLVRSAV